MTTASTHVLVTGGAGYLGSVLSRCLLDRGYKVTVLDNFMYRQNSLMDCCGEEGFQVVRGDCRDERLLTDLLRTVDIIVPLAALVGVPLCDRDRVGAYTVNFEAVQLLCKLSSPRQRIIFPVTNSGYGIGQPGVPCTEESPLRPMRTWWRNLRGGAPLTVRLAGVESRATGEALESEAAVADGLRTYFIIAPQVARYFQVQLDAAGQPLPADLARAAQSRVVIRIDLEDL